MRSIYFIEDCTAITAKEALRNASRLKNAKANAGVEFWIDAEDSNALYVRTMSQEPQRIALVWIGLTYGQMPYFSCSCGRRSAKLYLLPHGTKFACRVCQKLKYRSSSINKNSVAGKAIHQMERINKLADERAGMRGIFYKGKFTSRFNRFLSRCEQAGLYGVVSGAHELLETIKAYDIPTDTRN